MCMPPSVENPAGAVMTGYATDVESFWVMSTVSSISCRFVLVPAHEAAGLSKSRAAQHPQVTIPISCYRNIVVTPSRVKQDQTGPAQPISGNPAVHSPRAWCVLWRCLYVITMICAANQSWRGGILAALDPHYVWHCVAFA